MSFRPVCLLALLALLTGCQSLSTPSLFGRRALTQNDQKTKNSLAASDSEEAGGLPQPTNIKQAEAETDSRSVADEHFRLGEQELQQNRYLQAQKHFEEALREKPDLARAHHRLAVVADKLKDFEKAEHHYLAALESDVDNASLLSDLGFSYWMQGRYSESERFLKQALRANPGFEKAIANLGLLYGSTGRRDEALSMLRKIGTEDQAQAMLGQLAAMPAASKTDVVQSSSSDSDPKVSWDNPLPRSGDETINSLTRELFDRDDRSRQFASTDQPRDDRQWASDSHSSTAGDGSLPQNTAQGQLPEILANAVPSGVSPFAPPDNPTPFNQTPRAAAPPRSEFPTHAPSQSDADVARSLPVVEGQSPERQSLLWEQEAAPQPVAGIAREAITPGHPNESSLADVSRKQMNSSRALPPTPNVWPPRDAAAPLDPGSAVSAIQQVSGVASAQEQRPHTPTSLESDQLLTHAHHEEMQGARSRVEWTRGVETPHDPASSLAPSARGFENQLPVESPSLTSRNAYVEARRQAALLGLSAGSSQLFPMLPRQARSVPDMGPGDTGVGSRLPTRNLSMSLEERPRPRHPLDLAPQHTSSRPADMPEHASLPGSDAQPSVHPGRPSASWDWGRNSGSESALDQNPGGASEWPGGTRDVTPRVMTPPAASGGLGFVEPEPYPYRPQSTASPQPEMAPATRWPAEQRQPAIVPRGL